MESMDLVQARTPVYSVSEAIGEVDATLRLEGMPLTPEDIEMLKAIKAGKFTTDEARQRILNEV